MQRAEMEVIREVMLPAAATPIDEVELDKLAAKLHEVFLDEVWKECADEVDRRILELHYQRRMRFSEIAHEIGITESSTRCKWSRLMYRISESLQARVRSDEHL